jgi:HEAT repeat protein
MWFMPVLIVGLALAYVVSAYRIKRPYTEALIDMLEQDDYAFLFAQENTDVAIADPTALRSLAQRLEESDSPELKVFIARLLTDVGGNAAVPILEHVVREGEPQIRAILLDVLAAADVSGSNVRQLYVDCLSDPDEAVRLSAVIALERLLGSEDPTYLEEAQKLLMDPSLAVQAQVLPILLRSLDSLSSSLANQAIKAIFASQDAAQRATAVRILGQLNDPSTIPLVCQHANDNADEVRLEVALTLEILTHAGIADAHALAVLQSVTALMHDPIERVRQAALVVLGRIGSQVARELLVGALTDTSQNVRATAVDIIVHSGGHCGGHNGGPVIETVRARLKADDLQQQKMAAMVLSRINPDQFDELLVPHINQNLRTIYSHIGQLNALTP